VPPGSILLRSMLLGRMLVLVVLYPLKALPLPRGLVRDAEGEARSTLTRSTVDDSEGTRSTVVKEASRSEGEGAREGEGKGGEGGPWGPPWVFPRLAFGGEYPSGVGRRGALEHNNPPSVAPIICFCYCVSLSVRWRGTRSIGLVHGSLKASSCRTATVASPSRTVTVASSYHAVTVASTYNTATVESCQAHLGAHSSLPPLAPVHYSSLQFTTVHYSSLQFTITVLLELGGENDSTSRSPQVLPSSLSRLSFFSWPQAASRLLLWLCKALVPCA